MCYGRGVLKKSEASNAATCGGNCEELAGIASHHRLPDVLSFGRSTKNV